MKKLKTITSVVFAALLLAACDDTTNDLGTSLTQNLDNLSMTTDTFRVSSRSFVADSVYSRTTTGYLGKIRDPETKGYITGSFMAQFHVLENYQNLFPNIDSIASRNEFGEIIADSCEIRLFYTSFYGDSLAPMKVRVHEMSKPMLENTQYYSSFNPIDEGFTGNGYVCEKSYTLKDMSVSDETRNGTSYTSNILIPLNNQFTARDGKTYNNFGSYMMNAYYKSPETFGNNWRFLNEVQPGFFFEYAGGLGSMAYVIMSRLIVHFSYHAGDTILSSFVTLGGTEEVLQTTTIENDKLTLNKLAADPSCTYLKSPAGIFTEVTLPIDEIFSGHANDSVNMATLTLPRVNNAEQNEYALSAPKQLLMIPKDSLYSFFEGNQLANNRTSYLSDSRLSTTNSYVFTNISNLVATMNKNRNKSADWNKVLLVPVTITTVSTTSSVSISKIEHDMSLTSTRLVGGEQSAYGDLKMSVIYSKFK